MVKYRLPDSLSPSSARKSLIVVVVHAVDTTWRANKATNIKNGWDRSCLTIGRFATRMYWLPSEMETSWFERNDPFGFVASIGVRVAAPGTCMLAFNSDGHVQKYSATPYTITDTPKIPTTNIVKSPHAVSMYQNIK